MTAPLTREFFERAPIEGEIYALNLLPINNVASMPASDWIAALAFTGHLDVVGVLIARGWIYIAAAFPKGTNVVGISEAGMRAIGTLR